MPSIPTPLQTHAAGLLLGLLLISGATAPAQITLDSIDPPAAEEPRAPLLWKIQGRRPSWVFGTIHLSDPRVAKLPPEAADALRQADVLVTEHLLDEASQEEIQEAMQMPKADFRPLRHRLSTQLYEELEAHLNAGQSSLAAVEPLQLWAIALQLMAAPLARSEHPVKPLDDALWDLAGDLRLRREGLETVKEQLTPFRMLSESEAQSLLQSALHCAREAADGEGNPNDRLVQCYLDGDADCLAADALRFLPADEALRRRLVDAVVTRRNLRMAIRIDDRTRTHSRQSHFFAVGAGHLGGPGNVIELLRARGVRVERVRPPQ